MGPAFLLLAASLVRAATLEDALAPIRAVPEDLRLRTDMAVEPYHLKVVDRVMSAPLESIRISSAIAEGLLADGAPAARLERLAALIERPLAPPEKSLPAAADPRVPLELRGPVAALVGAIATAQRRVDSALQDLSTAQRAELLAWAKSLATTDLPDPRRLKPGESWVERDEQALAWVSSVRLEEIFSAARDLAAEVQRTVETLSKKPISHPPAHPLVLDSPAGRVVIGTAGPDVFDQEAALILDPGGDDVYRGAAVAARPGKVRVIVDLAGNDRYLGSGFGSVGSGVLGIGILADAGGSDIYSGEDCSQGCGVLGAGLLWDSGGDDVYSARSFSQGAGLFGVGLLSDGAGADVYRASYLSQGAGLTGGAGALVDSSGNDSYLSGYAEPDPRGYYENYGKFKQGEVFQSLSQGFGMGMREMAGGGVGVLADGAGNDTYQADYFGQGAGYWYSLGILYDASGNDTYVSRRYSQGAGVHFAAGLLLDASGNDRYVSWGVAQGVGHDFALGVLWDGAGNDDHVSSWLSMGASNAAGIGLLIDQDGQDRYLVEDPAAAYWDEQRWTAGIGLLLDSGAEKNVFGAARSTWAFTSGGWGTGLAQAGPVIEGLPPRPEDGRTPASYADAERKDGDFLRTRLSLAPSLGERGRILETLAVASGWGMNEDVPLQAKKALLREPPAAALPHLLERLIPKNLFSRLIMEEYFIGAPGARAALEKIASSDPDELRRARACSALGSLRSPEPRAALTAALADRSWRVRAAAARALGRAQGTELRERLAKLALLLKEPKEDALTGWFSSVEKTEALAALSLAPLSRDDWASVAEGLSQETTAAPAARAAARLAASRAAELRPAAEARAAAMASETGVPELVALLGDPDPEARRWAVFALVQLRASAAAVAGRLADRDYGVREAAAHGLGKMKALPEIRRALSDSAPRTRALALRALRQSEGKSCRGDLLAALKDPAGPVRYAALKGLEDSLVEGALAVPEDALRRLRRDDDLWVRSLAQRLSEPRP